MCYVIKELLDAIEKSVNDKPTSKLHSLKGLLEKRGKEKEYRTIKSVIMQ